jgi:LysM repeat protein
VVVFRPSHDAVVRSLLGVLTFLVAVSGASRSAMAQSLRGSASSLDRQVHQARLHDFSYLRRPTQLDRFVQEGRLVPVESTRDYRLTGVSFEVARPEVKLFLDRVGHEYRRRCGEPMVVTSLTRPTSAQPSNASARSVHPTGMAVDLRRPAGRSCRTWLESKLIALEDAGVLEATREKAPPHYHVAIFPHEYAAFVRVVSAPSRQQQIEPAPTSTRAVPASTSASSAGARPVHTVKSGETLWRISRTYGITVMALQVANGLVSPAVAAGQSLRIPAATGGR